MKRRERNRKNLHRSPHNHSFIHSHIHTPFWLDWKKTRASAFSDDWPQNQIWMAAFFFVVIQYIRSGHCGLLFIFVCLFGLLYFFGRTLCSSSPYAVVVFRVCVILFHFILVHSIEFHHLSFVSWRWPIATIILFFLYFIVLFIWFCYVRFCSFTLPHLNRIHSRMQTLCILRAYTCMEL